MRNINKGISRTLAIVIALVIIIVAIGAGLGYYYNNISKFRYTIAITVAGSDPIPLYWAYQNGLFQKYLPEANVEAFPSGGGAVIQAISSGKAQIGFVNIFSILTAIASGVPIKIVAVWDDSPYTAGVIVKSNSPFYNISQLEGKIFAESRPGSFDAVTLQLMVGRLGWGNNYTAVPVGSPGAQIAAVLSGKADASLVNIWDVERLIQTGQLRQIYVVSQEWPAEYIVASDSFISQHPDIITKVIQATYKIMQDYYSNANSSIQFMMKYYNFTEVIAEEYLHTVVYATTPSLALVNTTALKLAISALINAKVLPSNFTSIPLSSIYTNQFVYQTSSSNGNITTELISTLMIIDSKNFN
ncbi:ABC transporter substrate-binding protein [Sulfolobus sp. E11-6]|uniref:ABC transporter substrate-binding protein n=1 Tax=Sulfolobus sp. E11-6 TaxID=2663020 RepID=UPI001296EEF9|nr:ABC transporter substrate-binding protein [Sulfolobus sp. E11-6]QGA69034.1 PhnD/SsuA/transferrin family substrate-binding protein [Sulfolobus sp. E11-6]